MSAYNDPSSSEKPYRDPTPLPDSIPKVQELGTTSGPLKSAAFFLGAYCKDYNGACLTFKVLAGLYVQISLGLFIQIIRGVQACGARMLWLR